MGILSLLSLPILLIAFSAFLGISVLRKTAHGRAGLIIAVVPPASVTYILFLLFIGPQIWGPVSGVLAAPLIAGVPALGAAVQISAILFLIWQRFEIVLSIATLTVVGLTGFYYAAVLYGL